MWGVLGKQVSFWDLFHPKKQIPNTSSWLLIQYLNRSEVLIIFGRGSSAFCLHFLPFNRKLFVLASESEEKYTSLRPRLFRTQKHRLISKYSIIALIMESSQYMDLKLFLRFLVLFIQSKHAVYTILWLRCVPGGEWIGIFWMPYVTYLENFFVCIFVWISWTELINGKV